jgi:uncharacterized protein (TIGR03000 family)
MAAANPNQATVVVNLPADASLYVDGYQIQQRTFVTPALEPGWDYSYTVEARATRNGQTVSASKKVYVRAGQTTQVSIDLQSAATARVEATVRSRLTVRLPADARLFVNGQATTQTSATRIFETPPLQAGTDYSYTLRAEVVRDGQTQSAEKQVSFRAGRPVEVDFGDLTTLTAARR